ncbi:MAG: hypothetical protein AB4040_16885 [Synechococcus sp.]
MTYPPGFLNALYILQFQWLLQRLYILPIDYRSVSIIPFSSASTSPEWEDFTPSPLSRHNPDGGCAKVLMNSMLSP